MITFNALVEMLREMERHWRDTKAAAPRFVRPLHNQQCFALCNRTQNHQGNLPVIVSVGINYTQADQLIPDQGKTRNGPDPQVVDSLPRDYRERIALADNHARSHADAWWKCGLIPTADWSVALPEEYHLVLTNLSPWITERQWTKLPTAACGSRILANPPFKPAHQGWPFDHITELGKALEKHAILWVGHGVEAAFPHWHQLAAQIHAANWMLVGNLAAPIFQPGLNKDRTVVFGGSGKPGKPRAD